MICNNCGNEYEGNFCPNCGQKNKDSVLSKCPNCGTERINQSAFCAKCGYDFVNGKRNSGSKFKFDGILQVFSNVVYRYLGGALAIFGGLLGLICLAMPAMVESLLGFTEVFGTVAEGLAGKISPTFTAASAILLVTSLVTLVYGGAQIFFAIKKPFMLAKNKICYIIDAVICVLFLISGFVAVGGCGSELFLGAKIGVGFILPILFGVFGLIFVGLKVLFELKFFDKEKAVQNAEEKQKIKASKERKPVNKKLIVKITVPIMVCVVVLAIAIPVAVWAADIFRSGKADRINIGDSKEQVQKILGEPYKQGTYTWEYFDKKYVKLDSQIKKLTGDDSSMQVVKSKDDDFDEGDLDDLFGDLDKVMKLEEELNKLVYKYIKISFDSKENVREVLLDKTKCNDSEYKSEKIVKSTKVTTKEIKLYESTNIAGKIYYKDGSFHKKTITNVIVGKKENDFDNVQIKDHWNNETTFDLSSIKIVDNPDVLKVGTFEDSYFVLDNKKTLNFYSKDKAKFECEDYSYEQLRQLEFDYILVDNECESYTGLDNCLLTKDGTKLIFGCNNSKIPDSVTIIGEDAFSGCSSLTNITIPDNVVSVATNAFLGCQIENATIPTSAINAIPKDNLKSVVLTSGGSIDSNAFKGCRSLTSVTIGDSVTNIGDSAFEGCRGLTSITIGDSVTKIGWSAFSDCSSLKEVYITDIEAWCKISFIDYDSTPMSKVAKLYLKNELVTDLVIPDSVTSIGSYAFKDCTGLTSITIPNSVTEIGSSAFYECSSLTSIEYKGAKAEWKAITKGYRWNYDTGNFTIQCTDGKLDKNGNVIA